LEKKIDMSPEAYTVGFEKNNYHSPIFDESLKQEILQMREQEIQDNIVRYIGEYRLGVKFDEFYYQTVQDQFGNIHIGTQEGPVRDIFRRAITDREEKGLSVRREVAECLGFEKFEKELLERPEGSMAVWVSPPGKASEGYGGYSFTFIAQSEQDGEKKKIRVIPYRNEFTLKKHNEYLSKITGQEVNFDMDTQFLSNPFFIENSDEIKSPEDILEIIGEQEKFDNSWNQEFTKKAWPLIQGFIYLVKQNASDELLLKAKYALENFAIAFREDKEAAVHSLNLSESDWRQYDSLITIHAYIDEWGSTAPPPVNGSCGSTGGDLISALTLMENQQQFGDLQKDKYGKRTFDCPDCKKENVRPYNTLLSRCQHCKSANVAC